MTPPDGLGGVTVVTSSNEMNRLRQQMQRRIREVVAERRSARQNMPTGDHGTEPGAPTTECAECNHGGS